VASWIAHRNLLFGILALQMDVLGRDALIAGMHACLNSDSRDKWVRP
jgi:hypothetical protein